METANTLIRQIQDIKSHQKQTKTHSMTKPPSSPYAATQPGKPPMETITSGMGSMNMGNNNLPPGASPPYAVGTPTTSIDSRRQSTGGVPGYPAAYPYNQSAPPVTKPSLPPTGAPGYGYDQPPVTSPPGKYGPPGPGQMYEQPAATYDVSTFQGSSTKRSLIFGIIAPAARPTILSTAPTHSTYSRFECSCDPYQPTNSIHKPYFSFGACGWNATPT